MCARTGDSETWRVIAEQQPENTEVEDDFSGTDTGTSTPPCLPCPCPHPILDLTRNDILRNLSEKGNESRRTALEQRKQSGLGLASFVLALISALAVFSIHVIGGFIEITTYGGVDEESLVAAIIGCFILFFLFTSFVALGLGIGGLAQGDKGMTLAILGTIFSSTTLILSILIITIGLTME